MSPAEAAAALGVSRETLNRLETFVALLHRWNARINLVSAASLADVWRRHVLDSGQLMRHVPIGSRTLVDLGSGAGFPGLILAILGVPDVHLIESDRRKGVFLREAARLTDTKITLHAARIETVPVFGANIITARALAPLPRLLEWAARFTGASTVCLFLEGQERADELTAARQEWIMQTQTLVSISDPKGHILRVEGLHRAPDRSAPGPAGA